MISACLATGWGWPDVNRLIDLKLGRALSKCSLYLCSLSLSAETYVPIDYNGTHPVGEGARACTCRLVARTVECQPRQSGCHTAKHQGTLASVTVDGGRWRGLESRKL